MHQITLPSTLSTDRKNLMTAPAQPIKLYRVLLSGHSHRVALFLSFLGLPYTPVDVDFAGGEHKRLPYLRLNRFGQVPVIQDGDLTLADSNAILVYLASRYGEGRWLPTDPVGQAQVQRWLSVAAGQLAFGPCAARLINVFQAPLNAQDVIARAHALFTVLDAELEGRHFLLGGVPTIGDVALYTYTAHAPEGDVSLQPYPNIRAWLARVEALPGFVPMPRTAVGLQA
jgi:glutathione S-transferase